MPPARDPFFQVPRANARTSAGNVELPILYYDASALYAFFLVDQRRIGLAGAFEQKLTVSPSRIHLKP